MEAEIKDNNQATYPAQYETEAVLNDGSAMIFRPIKPDDVELFLAFLSRLGPDSQYVWLQVPKSNWTPSAKRNTEAERLAKVERLATGPAAGPMNWML